MAKKGPGRIFPGAFASAGVLRAGNANLRLANFMSSLRAMDLRDENLGEDDGARTMAYHCCSGIRSPRPYSKSDCALGFGRVLGILVSLRFGSTDHDVP